MSLTNVYHCNPKGLATKKGEFLIEKILNEEERQKFIEEFKKEFDYEKSIDGLNIVIENKIIEILRKISNKWSLNKKNDLKRKNENNNLNIIPQIKKIMTNLDGLEIYIKYFENEGSMNKFFYRFVKIETSEKIMVRIIVKENDNIIKNYTSMINKIIDDLKYILDHQIKNMKDKIVSDELFIVLNDYKDKIICLC